VILQIIVLRDKEVTMSRQNRSLGKLLLTLAIISDTHVNEGENETASPYGCNKFANPRFRYVVRDLNARKPDFTFHLGDMLNPVPELDTVAEAFACYKKIESELESDIYYLAGNHDVGDKPSTWAPVPIVQTKYLAQYRSNFGKDYYSIDKENCRFVVINSSLINSGLIDEREQDKWISETLERSKNDGVRVFIMIHYGPFIGHVNEQGSYDNIDNPGRSRLLKLLDDYKVEALYSGHVHNYFYNNYAGTHMYTVPATSFVRLDYSELFKIKPKDGYNGRDDTGKLGYFITRIYENGHTNELVRTAGQPIGENEAYAQPIKISFANRYAGSDVSIGIEMSPEGLIKHRIRSNASVNPFGWRYAHNDYPLLSLVEIGISKLRIPFNALINRDVVNRLNTLRKLGFTYTIYLEGDLTSADFEILLRNKELINELEVITTISKIPALINTITEFKSKLANPRSIRFLFNVLRDFSPDQIVGSKVSHTISYGFTADDEQDIRELVRAKALDTVFHGLVFRIPRAKDLLPEIRTIGRLSKDFKLRNQVHLVLHGQKTPDNCQDDKANANRIVEAGLMAIAADGVDLILDTFEDVDRGYYVRNGLVDRLYNPRLAGKALKSLISVTIGRSDDYLNVSKKNIDGGSLVSVETLQGPIHLLLPNSGSTVRLEDIPPPKVNTQYSIVDLSTGNISASTHKDSEFTLPHIFVDSKFQHFQI
jgi:3',5'-cyclic AMP phosphodiesterase CpdA